METLSKRKQKAKARLRKIQNKNRAIKLLIVFGPVICFLFAYFIASIYFAYATKQHNRLDHSKNIGGLFEKVKQKVLNEEPKKQRVENTVQD